MRTVDFTQNLLGMQSELHRFAMKLTADKEEADDLLQETSLKALDNEDKYTPDNMSELTPAALEPPKDEEDFFETKKVVYTQK